VANSLAICERILKTGQDLTELGLLPWVGCLPFLEHVRYCVQLYINCFVIF